MAVPTLLVKGNLIGHPDKIPIDYITQWIRNRLPSIYKSGDEKVLIIKALTGSGKSTVLPVYVFRIFRQGVPNDFYYGRSVICTQPRILTTIQLARDIQTAPYYSDLTKQVVGIQTGPYKERPKNGLIYATIGVLLAQLRTLSDDEIIHRYVVIILDEVHERSLEFDATIMLLKGFIQRNQQNPRMPFILLASATMDAEKIVNYIGGEIVEVTGRAFPIKTIWPKTINEDYISAAYDTIQTILAISNDQPPYDILVFMPGAVEITKLSEKINGRYRVLKIDRAAIINNTNDYKCLIDLDFKQRKIVISTVVAETGLTIPTLKYVIDCGWYRSMETYYPEKISGLITKAAPKSRILQRKGRVGRKFPGVFYPLYPENVYNMLPEQQLPNIHTEGVMPILLDIIRETKPVFDIANIDMLDPPITISIATFLTELCLLGFMHPNDGITDLGKLAMRAMYLTPNFMRLILAHINYEIPVRDAIIICAIIADHPRKVTSIRAAMRNKKVLDKISDTRNLFIGEVNALGIKSNMYGSNPFNENKYYQAMRDAFPFGYFQSDGKKINFFGTDIDSSKDIISPYISLKPSNNAWLPRMGLIW